MSGSQQSIIRFSQDIATAEAPPPLPARTYRAEVIGAFIRPAQSSGVNYLNLQFRIPAEEYPADYPDGDPDGTVLYYNRLRATDTPTDRHRWRVLMEKIGGPLGMEVDCNALIGLWGNVEVVHQMYEGENRASIARILSP
jgi:hypothetical protein